MKKCMLKVKHRMFILPMCGFLFLTFLLTLTGCGRNVKKDDIEETTAPVSIEKGAVQAERGTVPVVEKSVEQMAPAEKEPAKSNEIIEYSHEDIYMSIEIPSGWNYQIKTAEEMEKEDGVSLCAIKFWQEDYPDTVFTLSYETWFGICATGVTIEEYAWANGLSGYRYTEEIEDTLWLTITIRNPKNENDSGTYCVMASPAMTMWENIQPEFEEILKSVWVGSH